MQSSNKKGRGRIFKARNDYYEKLMNISEDSTPLISY